MSPLREGKRKINGSAKTIIEFLGENFGKFIPSTIIYEGKGGPTDLGTNLGGGFITNNEDWKQQIIHFLLI